jgi:hypothetical protein
MTELESVVNQLKQFVKEYTENMENIDKEHKGVRDYMKAYYQGKLDAYTHSLILVDILHKRMLAEEEEKVQHMSNMYDHHKEGI